MDYGRRKRKIKKDPMKPYRLGDWTSDWNPSRVSYGRRKVLTMHQNILWARSSVVEQLIFNQHVVASTPTEP